MSVDEAVIWLDSLEGDWAASLEIASQCAWSCELRWTPQPNRRGPDLSLTLFSTGAAAPDVALARCTAQLAAVLSGELALALRFFGEAPGEST